MSAIIFIGGFHELEEICALRGIEVIGAIDMTPSTRSTAKYLGSDAAAAAILAAYPQADLHVTPEKPQVRQKLWDVYSQDKARRFLTLAHPSAVISGSSTIGPGCAFHMGVLISSANRIGKGVKINTGGTITHDVVIEDFVTVGPRAVVCSACVIESGVSIGANATIMPGVRIGAQAIIGAGSVVISDVTAGTTVYGNPAANKGARS